MRFLCDSPCVVTLIEKETVIKINNVSILLPKNHLVILPCHGNIIDFPRLNNELIAHISREIINDYLLFINHDLTNVRPWTSETTPILWCYCHSPDVFRQAALDSVIKSRTLSESECTRSLLFNILSSFLEHPRFLGLLMKILRSSVKDSVYLIIQSNMQRKWHLNLLARELCYSPSLLKKKLKDESITYTRIVTDCRIRYAAKLLLIENNNVSQISQLCGYQSVSYFISKFKEFYGVTPLQYISEHRGRCISI